MWRSSLVIFWIITSSLAAQPVQGTPVSLSEAGNKWEGYVTGFGLTVEDAKKEALKHLVKKMTGFLRSQNPPLLAWQPTLSYVKRHVIQGAGAPGPEDDLGDALKSKSWIYPVKPLDLVLLRSLDQEAQRAQRRQERSILALQLYGGLALILAVLTVSRKIWGERRGVSPPV
jgi:hypothetical protein